MSLKRPVTIAQARQWPAAAARRESFCARMGGMREKLTSERTARDPRSKINQALAAWDCDVPELLEPKHVSKGVRPMKITRKMVGAEAPKARKNPARKPREKIEPFPSKLEGYGPRKGLEGPFLMRNGRVVYYDPAEGAYYDPTTDFYLTSQEASGLHSNPARKPAAKKNPRLDTKAAKAPSSRASLSARRMVYQVQESRDGKAYEAWATVLYPEMAKEIARRRAAEKPGLFVRVMSFKVEV